MVSPSLPSAVQRKRQRVESVYPRRRSVMACNICRGRKSKCDNGRPSCSFCLQTGAICIYEDQRSDYSNFDAASVHIINRLDSLERHLEERLVTGNIPRFVIPYNLPIGEAMVNSVSQCDKSHISNSSAHTRLTYYPVMESILEWPVFEGLTSLRKSQSLAIADSDSEDYNVSPGNPTEQDSEAPGAGLDIYIDHAIRMFLQNVHSKNPILDSRLLAKAVRCCSENGFDTSKESALVTIACALGLRSSPFVPSRDMKHVPRNLADDQAEQLFRRGIQILALQPPSLLATQCRFFCGVYEMFCIRPIAAWLHFSQASLQLKLHIHSRTFSCPVDPSVDSGLLQRLYWSCMQSECELSNELRTTTVGLEHLAFPYAFPQPPAQNGPSSPFDSGANAGQLESWMYYLSETSLRRVGNEIISTLYSQEPLIWKEDIPGLCVRAQQLLDKLDAWVCNLPNELRVAEPISESSNELGLHVRSRYLLYRSWALRPLLYIMIHASQSDLLQYRSIAEPLAYDCLVSCIDSINDVTYHHRHHGTWYTLRVVVSSALSIKAASRVNTMNLPPGWQDEVRKALSILESWSTEAGDLRTSLEIIKAA
ncbi:uncharacterized protein FOBCDRAFT_186363 [Fusarium oxysporum Fo47]|uniref:uncharacterized protein n=1 Tax=Fusarium oxysporum Fo47 TaxID=660027 RepID=UPI002869E515|nr:uncharacterized protein FOBCDRAFT_186363 [Fusarium oxysporum Fo47]WJG35741.1 hypothetical protein FOBCDRAFT_186363 [Fusarium oxysporum Fo47]